MTVEGIRRRTLLGGALGTAAAVGGAELWNAAPAHAEEVIKNPGFEEVTEGWPDSWEAFAERFDNLSVSQEQAHGGENSMLIDDDSATGNGVRSSKVPVEVGRLYEGSIHALVESGTFTLYL